MNTAALFHKANDNYCYPINENQLLIRLKTDYDVTRAVLCYGDPFENGILGGSEEWDGRYQEMTECQLLKQHKFWSIVVEPVFKRCRYYFEISDGKETLYLTEGGVLSLQEKENSQGRRLDYYFPWMNPSDIYTPPDWATDTVWYQIFPDRFCKGESSDEMGITKEWAGPKDKVLNEEIYGGTLKGIEGRLSYLTELGIGGIYLTPVNKSRSIHKYDTDNYYKVDAQFGTNEDMKHLVEAAHQKGIRIMMDGVFNHCGIGLRQWKDVQEKGPQSQYFDWFMINHWPLSNHNQNAREGRYYTFAFVDEMPKLNTNNPDVIEELLKICTYWVTEYNIDALRLDVANEISHTFCKALRIRMISLKPDFYIVGEIWHDSITWLRGDEFDSVMNYPLRETINDIWMLQGMNRTKFEQEINRCYTMYMKQTNQVLFNLMDSHDTKRLLTQLQDEDKFYQLLAVLFTMTGSCCIYYGTETALEGGHDPDCRRCMPWKEMERGDYNIQIQTLKEFIALRKRYKALRSGECTFFQITDEDRVFAYRKVLEGEKTIEVILNATPSIIDLAGGLDKGEVVCSRLWKDGQLGSKGFIIRERL